MRDAWVAALRRSARSRAVVLGYHGVAGCSRREDPFLLCVPPSRFRFQLELMLAAGFRFVTVAEFAAEADGGAPPPGLAALSFDDGLRNTLTTALPITQELGIPASLYIATDWLGGQNPWVAGEQGSILGPAELRELAALGWEIGTHTITHCDLTVLDYVNCVREVRESCATLEQIVGAPVQTIAYPFGRYTQTTIAAVRDSGLTAAITTGSGSWARFELTRAMVGAADPFAVVMLKITDRYEPILRVVPLRGIRTASRNIRHRHSDRQRGWSTGVTSP